MLYNRFGLAIIDLSLNEIQTRVQKFFGLEFLFQTVITQSKLSRIGQMGHNIEGLAPDYFYKMLMFFCHMIQSFKAALKFCIIVPNHLRKSVASLSAGHPFDAYSHLTHFLQNSHSTRFYQPPPCLLVINLLKSGSSSLECL